MLDLQAIVQSLGRRRAAASTGSSSRRRRSSASSSAGSTTSSRARSADGPLPAQVHLEPSDISEVTSRRVLSKNAEAEATLGALFDQHRGRLTDSTRLSADIRLPELTRQCFIDLYPLLPYQIDLIIQVVSGPAHPGRREQARRRRQPHDHQARPAAPDPPGRGSGERGSRRPRPARPDLRPGRGQHRVARSAPRSRRSRPASRTPTRWPSRSPRSICLLQFVQSVHRTAENIAACLQPGVDADSAARRRQGGARAARSRAPRPQRRRRLPHPTPAEDDWERIRSGANPKPGDAHRLHAEVADRLLAAAAVVTCSNARAVQGRPRRARA